jgi:hypothetical protein
LSPTGEFGPLGLKFSVHPSILVNSRVFIPGGERRVNIPPRGQISPLGPGVKLSMALFPSVRTRSSQVTHWMHVCIVCWATFDRIGLCKQSSPMWILGFAQLKSKCLLQNWNASSPENPSALSPRDLNLWRSILKVESMPLCRGQQYT